jgi:hypothetical protein
MATYLLEVTHRYGDMRECSEKTIIEAESVQMVKYWYHNQYKQFGFNPTWATDKHTIDIGGGEVVELEWIEQIPSYDIPVLEDYLPQFPKE